MLTRWQKTGQFKNLKFVDKITVFFSENGIEAIANEQTDSIKLLENRQLQLIEDLKQLVENVTEMLLSTQKNKKTKQIVENTDQQQEIVKFIKGVTPFCYIQVCYCNFQLILFNILRNKDSYTLYLLII